MFGKELNLVVSTKKLGHYTSDLPVDARHQVLEAAINSELDLGYPPTRNDIYRSYLKQPGVKYPLIVVSLSLNDLFRNDEILMDSGGNRYSLKKELQN